MPTQPLPFGLPQPPGGWPQKPAGISLCMIVKNEERFLERCLQSVAGIVDEINVVDTGSTDATLEIAARYGARVEQHEWRNDFAWARNKSLAMATKRWILQLDADEELLSESAGDLRLLKSVPAHLTALLVRCRNASDSRNTGGTVSHAITRIFPNDSRIRFRGRIHEFPAVDGAATAIAAVNSAIKIVHYGYLDSVIAERDKFARNTRMIEESVAAEPEEPYNWYNLGMTAHVGGDQRRAAEALERMWDLCLRHGMRIFAGNGLQMLSTIYTEHLGDAHKGLAFAGECLKIAPHYANAHFAAGKAHAALGEQEKAREMFLAAVDDAKFLDRQFIVDEDACGWKALCEIAATYAAQGDNVTALEWLDRALAVRPDVRVARVRRAMTLEALGRLDEAASEYDSMHAQLDDEQSALALVNFLLRRDARKAIETIEREYRKLRPETAVAMLLAAAALSQRNGWSDGEKHLLCARELAPGSAEVLAPLEELYRARGDEAAVARLREAENSVPPRTPADYARRAQIAISLNDFARAYDLARAGLSSAPQDAVLQYNAAIAAVNLGAKEEAIAYLEAIDTASGQVFVQAEYLRAVLLREMQRYDDALEALARMLSAAGPQIDALLLRGSIQELAGRKEEAEASFREALPLAKKRAAIELAAFYLREGRPADAQRVADEALA